MGDNYFKVLTIGKYGVGKTTIMDRIVDNKFNQFHYVSGIGVDFRTKEYEIEGKKIKVTYWDTCGIERFLNIYEGYFRGLKGIFLVFDLNDPESFNNVEYWFDSTKEHFEKLPPIFLIGSKSDLEKRVSERMIIKLSKKLGNLPIHYCSSLNGNGINTMENDLISQMLKLTPNDIVDKKEQRNKEIKKESSRYCYLV